MIRFRVDIGDSNPDPGSILVIKTIFGSNRVDPYSALSSIYGSRSDLDILNHALVLENRIRLLNVGDPDPQNRMRDQSPVSKNGNWLIFDEFSKLYRIQK